MSDIQYGYRPIKEERGILTALLLLVPIPIIDLEVDEVMPMAKAHLPSLSGERVKKRPDKLCRLARKTGPAMHICTSISIPAILLMVADVYHRYDSGHPFHHILILGVVDSEATLTMHIPDAPVIIATAIKMA
jgi:hypothetical protein